MSCPCGKGASLEACCGPIIKGDVRAATAEALMRSRYTAYATGHVDHVVATHDPKTRADIDREGAERWSRESKWLGLEVRETEAGGEQDDAGTVEFKARFSIKGVEQQHHERSRFRKLDGAWHYIEGDMVKAKPVIAEPKAGRNEPCPCGSGKKYKKCHGAAA